MAYSVTEKWTDRSSETSYTGATAARYFQVTGTLEEMANDRNVELAPGIPRIGQSHKKRRDLRVTNVIAGPGLVMREVTVYYNILTGEIVTGSQNPLTLPPIVEWTSAAELQTRTRDLLGNKIANSAGILFDPPPSEILNWYHVEVRRWEPRFDFLKSRQFFNTVNSKPMSSGGVTFPEHTVRCLSIMPAEPFAANDRYVNMSYKFDIRFEQGAFTGGAAPYGYRIMESNGAKRLAVDETESAIVREIFDSYLRESIGCKEIARRLRAKNIPTRRGRGDGWQFTSVRSILRNPVYNGEVSFNRREMVLRRAKGRRVPKFKDAAEVLTRQDEQLRIIDADTWQAVKDKIKRRETIPSNPTPSGPRPFTGLLHCSCGNVYHRKTSANSKATYHYWQCGAITMYDRCKDKPKVREDELVNVVRSAAAEVFSDAEGLIAEAIAEAEAQIGDNRAEASRIRQDIEAATADAGRLAMQLVDITEPAARRAIARLLGEAETRRETLQASLGRLADKATFDAEKLAQSVRSAVERAREDFTSILTPAEAHATMERYIGKVTVEADGTLTPKETPPAVAEGVTSIIAGGGFEPPTSGL